MNDPNTTDDLLDDLEAEFEELLEKGDRVTLDYAVEVAAPLWAAQELRKRVTATQEMLAEWREEAA